MAIFGGNLLCRASLGLQCRVLFIPWMKKSSGIRCSSGGANNSSFPVKYIPKKVRSTEKLQTSSTPKKDLKDKVNINGLEENELRLEISNGRKSSQTEKPRTSSAIMKAPKDNTSNNGLDENELRLEVSNDRKSSQTEKLWTSSAVTKGPEDNTSTNGLDENELWLEVSNDGKSSQTEKLRTSAITKGPKDNTSTNGLDKNELRLEVSNDWKSSRTEKLRTSSAITTGPKDNTSTNGLDENELRLEVSNARKSSQTEKLWTSSAITTGPKDNTSTNGSDENELRLEVSNDRKSSQTEKLRASSAITKGPKDNTSTNQLDENELRLEVSNGGKSPQRSFVLGKKSQNQYQTPAHYAAPDVNQEAVKGIDFDERVLETECIEELEEVLEEFDMNEEMNLHSQDVLQVGKTKQDAENLAIELLATRAYTAVELRKKLQGKRFPLDTVDAVILDFQSRGLINDSLFAETFSQSRWSSSSWGPRRIKQALLRKGVREAEAEKAINYVFKDGDSDEEEESMRGLSKISMDKLLAQASKQWLRGRDATKEKRKTRVIRWLQYRGFNWGVISFVVKKLESQCLP